MPSPSLVPAGLFGELGSLVATSSAFAKIILLILFVLSVLSWAVMFERWRRLRRAEGEAREFWRRFRQGREEPSAMRDVAEWCETHHETPLARLFVWFVHDFWPVYREERPGQPDARSFRSLLARGSERVAMRELDDLEGGLGWLATFSTVAPFIGLLGTVWGIMNSFLQIGRQGTATLEAVGPGIAEALITTVCGLAVAIPAVVGYNYLLRRLRREETSLEELRSWLGDLLDEEELRGEDLRPAALSRGSGTT